MDLFFILGVAGMLVCGWDFIHGDPRDTRFAFVGFVSSCALVVVSTLVILGDL